MGRRGRGKEEGGKGEGGGTCRRKERGRERSNHSQTVAEVASLSEVEEAYHWPM